MYDELKHDIQNGDIAFIRGHHPLLHRLIAFFTGNDLFHVGFVFWIEVEDQKFLMMLDVNGGTKRRLLSLSHYKDYDMDVIAAPKEWSEIAQEALNGIGKKDYSLVQAAYVGISERMYKMIGFNLPNVEFASEICSHVVAELLGYKDVNISPAKLYEQLLKAGHELRLTIRH
jgi:hypothetical protein